MFDGFNDFEREDYIHSFYNFSFTFKIYSLFLQLWCDFIIFKLHIPLTSFRSTHLHTLKFIKTNILIEINGKYCH